MSRFCHRIKHNSSSETIHNVLFIDVETEPIKVSPNEIRHQLTFGWCCYQRRDSRMKWRRPEWFKFTTKEQFYEYLERIQNPKKRTYIFCHNSNFDYPILNLFEYLSTHGYKLSVCVLSGPPTICRFTRNKSTLVILDTLNIWRMTLEKLGEIVGCTKLPMPSKDDNQQMWDTYTQRDVEIIRRAVTQWSDFLMLNDYGGFAPTLASQSMRLYRHRFLTTDIFIHDNERADELERNCYHGGRNEAYVIGRRKGRFTLLDANSMYPFVMRSERYPTKLIKVIENCGIGPLLSFSTRYLLCAHVHITTEIPAYPVYKDGKLIFPIGRFDSYLTTPEIVYGLEHGHIDKCYQLALYEGDNIFREFIDYLYQKRLQAEKEDAPTDAYLYKILMNSHYGKWGQVGYKTEYVGEQEIPDWKVYEVVDGETGKVVKYRQLGTRLEIVSQEGSARDSFPAIAAHVTAYARMYLWRLIQDAKTNHVLYVDTDSLLVDRDGCMALTPYINTTGLGALKVEGEFDDIEIYGCKDYRFGTKERHKGVKKNARWVTPDSVEQERWQSLRGILREGRLNDPHTKTIIKTLHRNYSKGIVGCSGEVLPIILQN